MWDGFRWPLLEWGGVKPVLCRLLGSAMHATHYKLPMPWSGHTKPLAIVAAIVATLQSRCVTIELLTATQSPPLYTLNTHDTHQPCDRSSCRPHWLLLPACFSARSITATRTCTLRLPGPNCSYRGAAAPRSDRLGLRGSLLPRRKCELDPSWSAEPNVLQVCHFRIRAADSSIAAAGQHQRWRA